MRLNQDIEANEPDYVFIQECDRLWMRLTTKHGSYWERDSMENQSLHLGIYISIKADQDMKRISSMQKDMFVFFTYWSWNALVLL